MTASSISPSASAAASALRPVIRSTWCGSRPATRRVVVGPREALRTSRIALRDVNWLGDGTLDDALGGDGREVFVKVRSTRPPQPAWLSRAPATRRGRTGRRRGWRFARTGLRVLRCTRGPGPRAGRRLHSERGIDGRAVMEGRGHGAPVVAAGGARIARSGRWSAAVSFVIPKQWLNLLENRFPPSGIAR